MPTAAIVGAGVAGLTTAHELAERGYDVTVYERQDILGGKARSVTVPGSGTDGRGDLPGEHGFRFFPRFYRHVVDTMSRIPYPGNRDGVAGNLVGASEGLFAQRGGPGLIVGTGLPTTEAELRVFLRTWLDNVWALSHAEYEFFAARLWQIMSSCADRRIGEYERLVWTDFIGVDRFSDRYRELFGSAMTHTLLAASGAAASARTVGDTIVQLMRGATEVGSSDRLLNGPTNDVWITPWVEHLGTLGVTITTGVEITAIDCAGGRITGLRVIGDATPITADVYVLAVPVERAAALVTEPMLQADSGLAGVVQLAAHVQWMSGIQFYLRRNVPVVNGHAVYMASPWGLTSISQQQFWPAFPLADVGDGTVRDVLSVDISTWTDPGIIEGAGAGKAARDCTLAEISAEVWGQLGAWLNVDGKVVLRDEDLHSTFLDTDIIPFEQDRPATDAEPLLVNDANTWPLRPFAYTRLPNLFLAADYVRTNTDLATMEGANEAGRRATNAILAAAGSRAPRCKVWNLHEPAVLAPFRWHDQRRYDAGLPWDGGGGVLERAASDVVDAGRRALHAITGTWRRA